MGFLADIGRARPSQNVKDVIQTGIALDTNERREALTQSSLAVDRERLMRMKNIREQEEKQAIQMQEWLPVDSLLDQFEGGADSPMAKFALKKAKSLGFVNENMTGMGGIQRQHALAMGQELSKPENVSTLSRLRLQHYTNTRDQAKSALMEKPGDEKLKQAYIEANAAYQAAFTLDPQVQKQVAAQQKDQLERDKVAATNERDRKNRESRERIASNRAGTKVSVGPDGVVDVSFGGAVTPLSKTSANKVADKVLEIDDSIELAKGVLNSYRSDYQTIATRWGKAWMGAKEKFGIGKKLSKQDKKDLSEYTTYRKRAVKSLATEIHKQAGGTLTKNEEKLYTAGLPNPGKGIFDGDSPTQFEAALVDSVSALYKAKARHLLYLRQGLSGNDISRLIKSNKAMSLMQASAEIDKIGEQKIQELLAEHPEMEEQDAKQQAIEFLKAEFSLGF